MRQTTTLRSLPGLRIWIALTAAVAAVLSFGASAAQAVDTPITISRTFIDFGVVGTGNTSPPQSVVLTNTGGTSFGPINIFGGAPPTAEFNASQNCQGMTLAPNGSCNVNYTFAPTGPGVFTDTSSFTISQTMSQSDGENFVVSLRGGPPPTPTLTPSPTCAGLPATIVGSEGANTLTGTPGPDVIAGLGGDDVVRGLGGDDIICGGDGNDKLKGGAGKDTLYGEAGRDKLNGGGSKDFCFGGAEKDAIGCEKAKQK